MPPFYWHLSFILIGYNSVLLDWGFIVSFRCLCISICKILKMAYVTSVCWRVFHEHLQCLPQSDCLLGYLFSFIFIVMYIYHLQNVWKSEILCMRCALADFTDIARHLFKRTLSSSKHSPQKDRYLSFGVIFIAFKFITLKIHCGSR